MLFFIGTTEIIVIAFIILLLFGGAKLPSLMKGLGKGVKEFKDEVNGINTKDESEVKKEETKE
ncbi:MAG: twin-arginine translocase TatA/TatE family subunit [Paludibacteraceae bacterium]|nr:twin-arginine translocase TatA/TatE family subunit [Paludibacteraceae bacterium]